MINNLPNWLITNNSPAFNDTESATAIEQTAKLYEKVREIVNEFNQFISVIETRCDSFENTCKTDYEAFRTAIRQEFQNFIEVVTLKLGALEMEYGDFASAINDTREYAKNVAIEEDNKIRQELATINEKIAENDNNNLQTAEDTFDPETNTLYIYPNQLFYSMYGQSPEFHINSPHSFNEFPDGFVCYIGLNGCYIPTHLRSNILTGYMGKDGGMDTIDTEITDTAPHKLFKCTKVGRYFYIELVTALA